MKLQLSTGHVKKNVMENSDGYEGDVTMNDKRFDKRLDEDIKISVALKLEP